MQIPILRDTEREILSEDLSPSDFDEFLEILPISYFHTRLLICSGLAFMADSIEVSLLSFISICAGEDWTLTNAEVASITAAVFAGQILGSLLWGPVADMYGRRFCLILAYSLIVLAGLLSAGGLHLFPPYFLIFLFLSLSLFLFFSLSLSFSLSPSSFLTHSLFLSFCP